MLLYRIRRRTGAVYSDFLCTRTLPDGRTINWRPYKTADPGGRTFIYGRATALPGTHLACRYYESMVGPDPSLFCPVAVRALFCTVVAPAPVRTNTVRAISPGPPA